MDVRNCKGCSRLFNYIGGQQLCPECAKALDLKFDEVRDYVYDHPRAGIQQVAEENEVTIAQIKRWIREERLAFSEDAQVGLECEGCGKMIRTGRFCEICKAKYVDYSLNCLLPDRFRLISYKDNPLLFILCVADTVEPSKRFADIIVPEGGENKVAIDILVTKIIDLLRK